MKEITIKLKGRDSWISVILGIYGALGAFISLSREATIDNSPDIDLERARKAEDRARERLNRKDADLDVARAELALKRALARQDILA